MKLIDDIFEVMFRTQPSILLPFNPEAGQEPKVLQSPLGRALASFSGNACAELGINEKQHPDIIKKYHKSVGLNAGIETAWCSSFTNYIVIKSGFKGTKSASARSWLKWGQSIDTPMVGSIVIFWRVSPDSSYGHVGFFMEAKEDQIMVLSGNQDNRVSIKGYPKDRLLGIRNPNV